MNRRTFLGASIACGGATALGLDFWRSAFADPAQPGPGPYGSLQGRSADANGLVLPEGFSSRVVATTGQPVDGGEYTWHLAPDGGATFAADDGGWVYVSNSELLETGGVGALRFGADGALVDAYPILSGTSLNCAGGPTPWGTWLSCEEWEGGRVWECDPSGPGEGRVQPALGVFAHEAVAVDPQGQRLYLTEDVADGRLYRFTPAAYPDLSRGRLQAAVLGRDDTMSWIEVPDPSATETPTREQAAEATVFPGGEGIWFDRGFVFFTTKGDDRVHCIETATDRYELVYDAAAVAGDAPLTGVDNITVEEGSGDLYVAEDGGNMELVIVSSECEVAPFLRIDGHDGSEVTGPAFAPDGQRLYVSSQRGRNGEGVGVTFEVAGPFRGRELTGTPPHAPATLAGATTTVPAGEPSTSAVPTSADPNDGGGGGGTPLVVGAAGAVAIAGGTVAFRRRGRDRDGE